jgi:hypothetical protein
MRIARGHSKKKKIALRTKPVRKQHLDVGLPQLDPNGRSPLNIESNSCRKKSFFDKVKSNPKFPVKYLDILARIGSLSCQSRTHVSHRHTERMAVGTSHTFPITPADPSSWAKQSRIRLQCPSACQLAPLC